MTCSGTSVKRAALSEPRLRRVRPLLGTFVEIALQGPVDEAVLHGWMTRGFSAVSQVDHLMSVHRPDSDMTRLNQAAAGKWVRVDPLTLKVLKAANELWEITHGMFDIRTGTAANQYGGTPEQRPARGAASGVSIKKDLSLMFGPACGQGAAVPVCRPSGVPPLRFCAAGVSKSGPWTFDLGGIAKGFAVDQAVECIQRLSSKFKISGSVNAGGDLRLWGNSPAPVAVRIDGVRCSWIKPIRASRFAMATSAVRRTAGAAQASYRNFRSGRLLKRPHTATVVANRCLWADALTKVVLLGNKEMTARCLAFYEAQAVLYDGAARVIG